MVDSITSAEAIELVEVLSPHFLGEEQRALVELADASVGISKGQWFPYFTSLEGAVTDLEAATSQLIVDVNTLNATKVDLDGTGATGTWNISITGTAGSAGTAATADKLTTPRTITVGATGKAFDGSANVTWSLAEIGAVSPTGAGASGTWPIAITGNAATVTNGIYSTGSYNNPAWLTGLAYSKLTGTAPTWNQNTTGSAARLTTARTLTVGSAGKTFNGSANVTWSLSEIGAVATGAITTSGLTTTSNRLLGRSTAGTGAVEELTVGAGLSLGGGVLSATSAGTNPLDFGNGFITWTREATVTPSTSVALLDSTGVALSPTKTYKVSAGNLDSTAQRGAVSLFIGDGTSFTHKVIYEQGTASSNVQLYLNAGVPSVSVYGGSGSYRIPYRIDAVANFGQGLTEFAVAQKVNDAPSDSKVYGRKNAAWVEAGGGAAILEITGASATLALTHANRFVKFNNATAQTITIPPQSSVAWPADAQIEGAQWGAGAVTFVAGSGVTLRKSSKITATTAGQYASLGLKRVASDEWLLFGDLGSV